MAATGGRWYVNVHTGSYVVCKQQGDIAFINVETGETETIRNVLYLPKAMDNIISEGELTKQSPGSVHDKHHHSRVRMKRFESDLS